MLLHNQGGNQNHSLLIAMKGVADNKSGIGAKVEVFADGVWQKFEITGASGYLSQGAQSFLPAWEMRSTPTWCGSCGPPAFLRMRPRWAKTWLNITELDRRGSLSHAVRVEREKYEFISDVIGAAVIGHWVSPTQKTMPIRMNGSRWKVQLRPRGGYLSLRFGEPMEEVNYHRPGSPGCDRPPGGHGVYPNERFLNEPPLLPAARYQHRRASCGRSVGR